MWVRLFLSEVVWQLTDVRVGILLMSHRWGSAAPWEPTFISENRYPRSHTYSETRAAERKFREHRKLLNLCAYTEVSFIDRERFLQSLENLGPC